MSAYVAIEAHLAVVTKLHAEQARGMTGLDAAKTTLRAADRSPAGARARATIQRVQRSLTATHGEAMTVKGQLERARESIPPMPRSM